MKTGHRTTLKAGKINYKVLRRINPEAARLAVIEYLSTNKGYISEAARVFGIQRTVVYDILKKKEEGDLRDRSRTPLHSPYKTPAEIEDQTVEAKNQTHLGAKRLSVYLKKYEKIEVPYGAIRHILRRNKSKLSYQFEGRRKSEKREFVDWYSAKPFQVVQVDFKFIRNRKALAAEQIIHLDYYGIPWQIFFAIMSADKFKDMTSSQIVAIFDKYLEEHPKEWHYRASSIFIG